MSEAVLELRDLHRTYQGADGPIEVLRGVDLAIAPGEIVGLIGPSGSGKSSLLHAAGLLERPTRGVVRVAGQEGSDLSEAQRTRLRRHALGFVYQFHHLLAEFSALDNVAMPAEMAGLSRKAARDRARELLDRLGLTPRLDHQPARLSGGEQQRVAVARALVNRPKLLLADEPTGNLDAAASEAVFASIRDLSRSLGVAALIATHNLDLAGKMDRVLALRSGRISAG